MSPKGRYSGGSSGGVQRMGTVGGPLGESKGRVQWGGPLGGCKGRVQWGGGGPLKVSP